MDRDNAQRQSPHSTNADDGDEWPLDPRSAILAAKLRPPHARDGIVPRIQLVDQMLARRSEPVVAVVAPPGYGKTTLLAEWATKQTADFAWVSVDQDDDDPSVLLAATAMALSRAHVIDPGVADAVTARSSAIPTALSVLTSAFESSDSLTLVMDNVEAIENVESLDLIAELAWRMPAGSRFAYGSRSPIPLPTALLRSRGALVEVGVDDLAMDRVEAQQLLSAAGAKLNAEEIDTLLEQTEGWPAGLYLAGLASKGRRQASAAFAFSGDDVLMSDYLRTEVLSHLPTSTVTFLTRTSVLDELSGPLCDAILGERGSQAVLEALEASNLLLVPLDRQRSWFRYHRLFRDLLATELERREPDRVPELHSKAAQWLEGHGMPESAIRQAQKGGEPDRVARLVTTTIQPAYATGRATEVRSWLEWFRSAGLIEQHPEVAVLGAVIEALSGGPASAERWSAAAEAAEFEAERTDEFTGSLAYLRSVLCRGGPAQSRIDAQQAIATLSARHGLRPSAILFEALSYVFEGDLAHADPVLARTVDICLYANALPAASMALALRASIAIKRQEWDDAEAHTDHAVTLTERGHLQDYFHAGAVYAVAAQVAAHRSDVRAAADLLAQAARIRPLLSYAAPASALIQLEIVRAYLLIGDTLGARTVLRETRNILHQRPDLGVVAEEADELQRALEAIQRGPVGASSLTTAELRLLPLLSTHLTFPEIGERLHVSRHTVKTQAMSVYRKFGVTSRNDAIQHAHEVGLLGR